jgi:hypothetical protein
MFQRRLLASFQALSDPRQLTKNNHSCDDRHKQASSSRL